TLSGRLIWRYGYRTVEIAGMLFCIIASIMYLGIGVSSSPLYIALCSFVMGVGLGLASTTQIVSIQSTVDWKQRGIATSSVMFSRILGSTLLVAMLGTVVNTSLTGMLAGSPLIKKYGVSDSVSITNLLLDPVRRATLPHANLDVLADALAYGIHMTFWLVLIASIIGLFASFRMPAGVPDKHGKI
ncbi:MAG: MFS transporter, partial [Candidatus Aquicultor sp.]